MSDTAKTENSIVDIEAEKQAHITAIQEVIAKIDKIADELESEVPECQELGQLTDKACDLMFETGMGSAYLGKELGGMGLYPGEALPIMARAAKVDGSIGWLATIFASGGLLANYMTDSVSEQLYSGGGHVAFSAVSNGFGTAVQTDEGWVVTGKYRYASGIKHARYAFVPAMQIIDGKMVPPPEGYKFFPIPVEKVKLGGGWDVIGLKATGSVDFSVDGLLIPHDHMANLILPPLKGGKASSGGLLVLIPIMHLGFAIGITERILEELKIIANREPAGPPGAKAMSQKETFRTEYTEKYMKFRASNALIDEVMSDIDDATRRGEKLTTRQESMLRAVTIHSHELTREIAEWAFKRGGGTALRDGTLNRNIRDALAGCQHFIASDAHYSTIGIDLLGAPEGHGWKGMFEFGELPPMP